MFALLVAKDAEGFLHFKSESNIKLGLLFGGQVKLQQALFPTRKSGKSITLLISRCHAPAGSKHSHYSHASMPFRAQYMPPYYMEPSG